MWNMRRIGHRGVQSSFHQMMFFLKLVPTCNKEDRCQSQDLEDAATEGQGNPFNWCYWSWCWLLMMLMVIFAHNQDGFVVHDPLGKQKKKKLGRHNILGRPVFDEDDAVLLPVHEHCGEACSCTWEDLLLDTCWKHEEDKSEEDQYSPTRQ